MIVSESICDGPKVTVHMTLNVKLTERDKFDRFTPRISLIDINVYPKDRQDEQISDALECVSNCWTALSDGIEKLCTDELQRKIKIGESA